MSFLSLFLLLFFWLKETVKVPTSKKNHPANHNDPESRVLHAVEESVQPIAAVSNEKKAQNELQVISVLAYALHDMCGFIHLEKSA